MRGTRREIHRTGDGAEIAYRVRPGPNPRVLLHALGCDGSMWEEVVARLPAGEGVIVPDLRGHGASTLGWEVPSVERWAVDVAEILETETIASPAIAGISMGGYTAMALRTAFRGTVRGWGFLSTTCRADDAAGRAARADAIDLIRRSGLEPWAEAMAPKLLSAAHPRFERHRTAWLDACRRAGAVGIAAALVALANRPDLAETLRGIDAPVLALGGEADPLTPPERIEEIASAAPRARIRILPRVAHLSAVEDPAAVAEALESL